MKKEPHVVSRIIHPCPFFSPLRPIALEAEFHSPHFDIYILLEIPSLSQQTFCYPNFPNPPSLISRSAVLHFLLLLLLLLLLLKLLRSDLLLIAQRGEIPEPQMHQGLVGTDTHFGPDLQHAAQEIQSHLIDLWEDHAQILRGVDVKSVFVFRELGDAGPGALRGGAHQSEDFLELVFVGSAGEEWTACVHLRHNATGGPDVNAGVVCAATQQDVRGPVPERDNFVGEGIDWDTKGTSKTEIGEFELALVINEKVLGFQITVQDAVFVAEGNSLEKLVHEGFDGDVVKLTASAAGIHVFLQILIHVFKDQHELVLGVDDIVEGDNVIMLQLLHERDLADGCGWCAFFRVQMNLFECDEFARLAITSFEHLEP